MLLASSCSRVTASGPGDIRAVLERAAAVFGHQLETACAAIGGAAIEAEGVPLPEATARAAEEAPATLLGAVGLPRFDHLPPERRPERGLLDLRRRLGVFANLRPSRSWPRRGAS